MAEKKEERSQ